MIILITGATSGFGKAIAEKFLSVDNTKVIGIGRRKEKLEELSQKYGSRFFGITLDIQDEHATKKALNALPADFENVDLLVNNAGLALGLDLAQNASLFDWQQMVNTNINGLLYCTHAILPKMVERKKGHIINMGSVAADIPYPGGNIYGATKAFVKQFSLNLRADLLGTPIRVTDVEPGLCGGTEFSDVRFKGDHVKAQAIYKGTQPLTADDIAGVVYWIAGLPPHVNVNTISLMPVDQAFGPTAISRRT